MRYFFYSDEDDCGADSHCSSKANKEIEANVLRILTDAALSLPVDSTVICRSVSTEIGYQISHTVVCNLLQKFAAQELIKYVQVYMFCKYILQLFIPTD